uniref:EGF-like domain-containing protein n=1 Tax=Eptatretus burgeri TaxID=7764 RepID=A0A8C4Q3C9_EPTBU
NSESASSHVLEEAGSHRSTGSACPRCHPLAKCQPTGWCACAHGYVGNGVNICFDVDECAVNVCNSENEICLNTAGSYECSCKQGYVRLSSNCQKVHTTTSITNTAEYVSASTPVVSASTPVVSASTPAVSASTPAVSASIPVVSASTPAVSAAELSFNTSGHPQNKTANDFHASWKCSPQARKRGGECHCDEGYGENGAHCIGKLYLQTSMNS